MAAIRSLYTRMGFSVAAAQSMVDEQGLTSLDDIKVLTDQRVEALCKVIRRPGGREANVAPGDPGAANLGIQVSLKAENNLMLAAYWLRHQDRVSRVPNPANVTLESVRSLAALREANIAYRKDKDTTKVPSIDAKDWPKTIEAIETYLRSRLGQKEIPLAYVVRRDIAVPEADPPTNYRSRHAEMIRRAPHGSYVNGVWVFDDTYIENSKIVFNIIAEITRDHACWTYVKPAQADLDGREAFKGLYDHYLGPNNVDIMASAAEKTMQTTVYNGEMKRWDFEKFVNLHKQQHSILDGLVLHGYAGIDERSKVRHLVEGIKTDKLDTIKGQILASAELRSSFDKCVTLFQDFIRQQTKTKSYSTLTIAEVSRTDNKRKASGGSGVVEDRYYTKEEYNALDPEQKKTLSLKRAKRGHTPGTASSKVKGSKPKSSPVAMSKAVKKLVTRQVAELTKTKKADNDDASDASDSTSDTPVTGNRNNKALVRKTKK